MHKITTVQAPAKLNLFLHITGRRADGYHLLESALTLIDLCDTLHFQTNDDGTISRTNDVENVPEAQDLIIRAAGALRQRALDDERPNAALRGAKIGVNKRIPLGGGLGGGSSNAATTLKTLNKLWHFNYPDAVLAHIGLKLGADVPFFIFGKNAFAQGVGEQLRAVNLPNFAYLVVKPDAHVPTPAIFAAPELTRSTKTLTISDFSALIDGDVKKAEKELVSNCALRISGKLSFTASNLAGFKNDMQSVVLTKFAAVAEALAQLQEVSAVTSAFPARMTGSGACIFAAFTDEAQALLAQQRWQEKASASSVISLSRAKTFVVKSCSCSL